MNTRKTGTTVAVVVTVAVIAVLAAAAAFAAAEPAGRSRSEVGVFLPGTPPAGLPAEGDQFLTFDPVLDPSYLMFDAELANITGNPAMSVPFGFDPQGLPVGVHVLGRYGDEGTLFRLAAQLAEAAPWSGRHPDLVPSTKTTAARAEDYRIPKETKA